MPDVKSDVQFRDVMFNTRPFTNVFCDVTPLRSTLHVAGTSDVSQAMSNERCVLSDVAARSNCPWTEITNSKNDG